MNNRQNGRRRGRGGQQVRNGQPGNADRGNRIDNRARGNAAQLLEKYKSLARDAQTQGDRVNTEYYLQFADHYFRVLSESRSRFEEQRPQQRRDEYRDEFGQDGDFDGDGDGERAGDGQGWNDGDDDRAEAPAPRRFERPDRPERMERPERVERAARQTENSAGDDVGAEGDPRSFEPRQERAERRPRRERAPGDAPRASRPNGNGHAAPAEAAPEVSERIEVDRLPQGFAAAAPAEETQAEAPAPRRRAPRRPRGEATTVEA